VSTIKREQAGGVDVVSGGAGERVKNSPKHNPLPQNNSFVEVISRKNGAFEAVVFYYAVYGLQMYKYTAILRPK